MGLRLAVAACLFVTATPTRLCAAGEDSFSAGAWTGAETSGHTSDSLSRCPSTFTELSESYDAAYLCKDKAYPARTFTPLTCAVRADAAERALGCLAGLPVVFAGDSQMRQEYWAVRCELEAAALSSGQQHLLPLLNVSFVLEEFLRSDLPCQATCANATYLASHQLLRRAKNRCRACGPGGARLPHIPPTEDEAWLHTLRGAHIAVLGSGAWYNDALVDSPAGGAHQLYASMLAAVSPALARVASENGTWIYWLDMPPRPLRTPNEAPHFQYDAFAQRNTAAAAAMRSVAPSVTFLNTSAATAALRALRGGASSTHGLHWCSPGVGTAPTFVAQHLLNDIVMRCANKRAM